MPEIEHEIQDPVECEDGVIREREECIHSDRFGWCEQSWYDNYIYTCDRCYEEVHEDDMYQGLCQSCNDEDDDDFDEEDDNLYSFSTRDCNTSSKKQRSSVQGEIIKSMRPYGVEIECLSPNSEHLSKLQQALSTDYGMKGDGSLRRDNENQSCIEVVTPVLQGDVGEKSLINLVTKMNSLKYTVNNSCGLHIHLDSQDFHDRNGHESYPWEAMTRSELEKKLAENKNFLKGKTLRGFTQEGFSALLSSSQGNYEYDKTNVTRYLDYVTPKKVNSGESLSVIDSVLTSSVFKGGEAIATEMYVLARLVDQVGGVDVETYGILTKQQMNVYFKTARELTNLHAENQISRSEYDRRFKGIMLDIAEKKEEDFFVFERTQEKDVRPMRIRQLLMFYLVFTPVLVAMLPSSRRTNRYCQDVTAKLTVPKVDNIKDINDVLKAWYQSDDVSYIRGEIRGHYNDSRYFGVNLHSMFRNGTVEIRYHSGTTNLEKIINWIIIHQAILDKASNMEFDIEELKKIAGIDDFGVRFDAFCAILELENDVIEYMAERIQHFNKCKISSIKIGSLKTTTTQDEETMTPKKIKSLCATQSTNLTQNN